MKQPKVSVGITVKNSVDTIFECIESIMKSSYPIYEILVVDAFSTDGTWEILKSFGKRIRALQKAGNVSVGRNEIIKQARGELIAFTDADCVVDRNSIEILVGALNEKGVVASGGPALTPDSASGFQKLIGRELEERFRYFPKYVQRLTLMNFCVRADTAKKNLIDERLAAAEDADFCYKISKKGKIVFNSQAVVWHAPRATLLGYFKQQMNYGKYAIQMYMKFKNRAGGDEISRPLMIVQPPLFSLGFFFLLLSYAFSNSLFLSEILFLLLGLIYLYDAIRLTINPVSILTYLGIFFIRTLAWSIGLLLGIKEIFLK